MSAFEDGMGAPMRAAAYVQGQGELGRERRDDKRRRGLAAAYFSGGVAPESTGQFLGDVAQAGGDPLAYRRDAFARAGQRAALLMETPDALKPQAYGELVREMHGLGFQVPPQFDPHALPMIAKFAQQHGGATAGGTRVQSTYIDAQGNRVAIMADGSTQVLGQNAPQNQILDTGNGVVGIDKLSLRAAPVIVGEPGAPVPAPAPTIPRSNAGQQDIVLDDDTLRTMLGLPVEERQAMLAAARSTTPVSFAAGADGEAVPATVPQQLRTTMKPAEEERLRLAREAADRAEEASQRAADASRRAELGNAPAGYRFNAAGGLEKIPGGPQQTGKPLSSPVAERLAKQAGIADNTAELRATFKDDYAGNTITGAAENVVGQLGLPGATPGQADWWQQYDRQKNAVRNELFGSALTPSEQAAFERADIRPDMAPARIRANLAMQERIARAGLERRAKVWKAQGFNAEAIDAAVAPTSAVSHKVGDVIESGGKRYRVTGGDPSDPDVEEIR